MYFHSHAASAAYQHPQVLVDAAERVLDGHEPAHVVPDGILRGDTDAAVQLNRFLPELARGPGDLQLRPRRDHGIDDVVG